MKSIITTQAGHIQNLNGTVTANINGSLKQLSEGELVPAGTNISIAEDAFVEILLDDGSSLSSSSDDNNELLNANSTSANSSPSAEDEALSEIEAIQALIASGEDPTAGPDTAAGGQTGNEGGSSHVSIARGGSETIADAGHDTSGQTTSPLVANLSLNPPESNTDAGIDNSIQTAQFTDNFVNGVAYTTSSGLTGLTGDSGSDGSFSYREGDTITFTIGNVTIANFSADSIQGSILFLQDIAGTSLADSNLNYVENMAIFLQALDNDLSDGTDDGVLQTNSLVNLDASYGSNINISTAIHEALSNYIDPTTGEPLNIATAGKEMLSQVLAQLGIEFTRDSERSPDEQNVFESLAMGHVADTIEELAGDRAPDAADERTVDVLEVPGGLVTYNYNELDGSITFSAEDLLEGATAHQVISENLIVKNVRLSADFEEIGTLVDLGDGNYSIILNDGVDQYDLEGLTLDYRVEDWTAFREVTSSTQDQFKSHLSADIPDVSEGDGFNQFTLNSELVFEQDSLLEITFTSELLSEQLGIPIAEYADDYTVPIQYSNDGGLTWQAMTVTSIDYSGSIPRPVFGFELSAGDNSVMIRVPIFDDAKIEPTEYFRATVTGENVYDELLEFAIFDNDAAGSDLPLINIDYAIAVEGMENAVFTLSLSEPSDETITVNYSSEELSALFGEDFIAVSGTVTFLPGQTTAFISVPIVDDLIVENPNPEFALINLSDPTNAQLADSQGTLRIFDNDSPANADVSIDLDPITGDNVITTDEGEQNVTITGTVNADAAITIGIVVISINGTDYQTLMNEDGSFSITVEGSELLLDADTVVEAVVHGFGHNGERGEASTTEDYDLMSIVQDDTQTIDEDSVASGNVLDNDSDLDDELTVSSFEVEDQQYPAGSTVEVEGGELVINTDGSYTFTPNENWNGEVPVITYTTNTGESATLTLEVKPVDDPTIARNDSNTIEEDTPATGNVLTNDTDVDTELTVTEYSVSGNTYTAGESAEIYGGIIVINEDGSYTFTPFNNWNGEVPVITYTTNTGESAELTIEVKPVDDPTIARNDTNTVEEDTPATGNVLTNDTDVDNELTVTEYSVSENTYIAGESAEVEGGIIVINEDGTYTFTPFDNWNGEVPVITYTTNTGESAELTLEVTPVNDPGSFVDQSFSYDENQQAGATVATLVGSDEDNVVNYQFQHVNGSLNSTSEDGFYSIDANGVITITAAGAASAANDFETTPNSGDYLVTMTDGAGDTTDATITLSETNLNEDGEFTNQSFSYDENQQAGATVATLVGSDEDNVVNYQFQHANGSLNSTSEDGFYSIDANGVITITAAGAASAANDFETTPNSGDYLVTMTDGAGDTTDATITLSEDNLNEDGEFTNQSFSYDENQQAGATVATLVGSDEDNVVNYQFQHANGSLNSTSEDGFYSIDANGVITITAAGAASAANDFETTPNSGDYLVTMTDGAGDTTDAIITLSESNLDEIAPNAPIVTIIDDDNPDDEVLSEAEIGDNDVQVQVEIDKADFASNGTVELTINNGASVTTLTLSLALNGVDILALDNNGFAVDGFSYNESEGTISWTETTPADGEVVKVTATQTDEVGNQSESSQDIAVVKNDTVTALGQVTEGTTGNVLTLPDSISFEGTTALGGTVSLVNGSYVYAAPIRDHADNISDQDSFSITNADGTVSIFTIDITDTAPVANDDTDSIGFSGTAYGNVITGAGTDGTGIDNIGADATSLVSVSFNNTIYDSFDADGNLTIITTNGQLLINQDGSYTYLSTLTESAAQAAISEQFSYLLSDADSDISGAILTINQDSSPVAEKDANTVSESGLVGGTMEGSSSHITTGNLLDNDAGVSGSTSITSIDNTQAINGIITVTSSHGTLTVYTDDSHAGFRAGDYQYELNNANLNGSDILDSFNYVIENDFNISSNANLDITIVDDQPIANNIVQNLQASADPITTNLTLVLDVSGSMDDSAGNGKSYLETAIDALTALINEVDTTGNVNVQIVAFSSGAASSGWLVDDIDGAINYLNQLVADGSTNYLAALNSVMGSGALPTADQSFVYFISDGVPSQNQDASSVQTNWENYVTDNYDLSFGIGIGNASLDALKPIAHPEVDGNEDYAILVNDAADLTNTILDYFDNNAINGNLGIIGGNSTTGVLIGADGGYVTSITIDGTTYDIDFGNPSQTIITELGGTFTLDFMTGEYKYFIDADENVLNQKEIISVNVVDNDQDTASLTLQLNVDYHASIDANVTNIITNFAAGSDLSILSSHLTHGDATPDGSTITSVTNGSGANVSLNNGIIDINNAQDGDNFDYTLTGNGASDSTNVAVEYQDSRSLEGTHENDILMAASTASSPASAVINATVKPGNTYSNTNQFGFEATMLAAGVWISQIQIDLRAGTDTNAEFDISDTDIAVGSASIGINDSAQNIFADMTSDNHVLTMNFTQGDFTQGDAFWFAFDTDSLGSNVGSSLADKEVTFTITLSDGSTQTGVYIPSDEGGSQGILYFADSVLDAGAGDDVLIGGEGNDVLIGGNGDDILIGGLGDDFLIGGLGEDTFVWAANSVDGTDTTDHITDFNLAEDKLDLSDILQGDTVSELAQYISFSDDNGSTVISIDTDGNSSFDQHIVLDGVDLFELYGNDPDAIITGLLGNNGDGALIVSDSNQNQLLNTPSQLDNPLEQKIIDML